MLIIDKYIFNFVEGEIIMKKILSVIFSIVLAVSCFISTPFTTNALPFEEEVKGAEQIYIDKPFSIYVTTNGSCCKLAYIKFVPNETGDYEFSLKNCSKVSGTSKVRGAILDQTGDTIGNGFIYLNSIHPSYYDQPKSNYSCSDFFKKGYIYYLRIDIQNIESFSADVEIKKGHTCNMKAVTDPAGYLEGCNNDIGGNGKVFYHCFTCGRDGKTIEVIPMPARVSQNCKYVYDGYAKKPKITLYDVKGNLIPDSNYRIRYSNNNTHNVVINPTNVGEYSIAYQFNGERYGPDDALWHAGYLKIVPKGTSLVSLNAVSKGFKVKWKKQSTQTTGYQIQYSTYKSFKNAKTVTVSKNSATTKTISKLKAKKNYFVRVRTYKSIKGNKYYSSWSKVKYTTTKK